MFFLLSLRYRLQFEVAINTFLEFIPTFSKRVLDLDTGTEDMYLYFFQILTKALCDIVLLVKDNHIMFKGFVMEIFEIKFVHEWKREKLF